MSSDDNRIYYQTTLKKHIFLIENDIDLLKRLAQLISDQALDYQIFATDNLVDARNEMKETRPHIIIMGIDFDPESSFKFIEDLRGLPDHVKTPIILMGVRNILETKSDEIERFHADIVPKAIRTPYFLAILNSALKRSQCFEGKLLSLVSFR
jgi:DNA-binding response OmpR family regulator